MPVSSVGCPSVRCWTAAASCAFLALALAAEAQPVEPHRAKSVVRLTWLTDLGAEALAASEASEIPRGTRRFVALAPGAAYLLELASDGVPQKRVKRDGDSAIPYGAAVSGDLVVLASSDGTVGMWRELEALEWRIPLGERVMSIGWDGGDTVWIATRSGRLLGVASADGEEAWSTDIGGRAEGAPVRDGELLYVATKHNALFGIDASTGKVRWQAELPGPALHPPVIAGDETRLVVVATWNGHIVAFDASGELVWTVELSDRLAGAPVAGEDFVAAVSSDGIVRAYDLSGALQWEVADAASDAADLDIHEELLVISNVLGALDPPTGERRADYPDGAVQDLKQRFLDAMIEGERTFTETDKAAVIAREAFPISGRLFGEARIEDDTLLFSTEDGWIYLFDASSLRPRARYRGGQRAHLRPLLTPGAVVAASSDEIFALGRSTGEPLWRRSLAGVQDIVSGAGVLAVIADDRLSVVDLATGNRRWRAEGEFQTVLAPAVDGALWLAVSTDNRLVWLEPTGDPVGAPLDLGAEIVSVAATAPERWAVATSDGRIVVLSYQEQYGASDSDTTEISTSWEIFVDTRTLRLGAVDDALLVESEAGEIVALSEIDGTELWRLPLEQGARYHLEPGTSTAVLHDDDTLAVYDIVSGEPIFSADLTSPAVTVSLRDDRLLWLDRAGRAHETNLFSERETASTDLGASLDQAFSITGGFVVTTTAGEVGLVVVESDESLQEDEQ